MLFLRLRNRRLPPVTRLRSNFSRRRSNGFCVSFSALFLLLLLLKPPERGGVFSGSAVRAALHDVRVSAWGALLFLSLSLSPRAFFRERKMERF